MGTSPRGTRYTRTRGRFQIRQGVAASAAASAVHVCRAANMAGAARLRGSSFPGDCQGGRAVVDDTCKCMCRIKDGSNGGRVGEGGRPRYEIRQEEGGGTETVSHGGGPGSKRCVGKEPERGTILCQLGEGLRPGGALAPSGERMPSSPNTCRSNRGPHKHPVLHLLRS